MPDAEMRRTIQEFSYPDVNRAVPRYFNSQSFRQGMVATPQRILLPA